MTMQRYAQNLCEHVGVDADPLAMLYRMAWSAIESMRELSGKRLVVETITPYLDTHQDVVAGIARTFPGAPIVHLVRDGRDVLVSGVLHWLSKSGSGADEAQRLRRRRWLLEGGEALERLFVDDEILEWARAWREAHDCARGFESSRVLRVTYEQMHESHEGVLRLVCNHIGARADDGAISRCVEVSRFGTMSGGQAGERLGAHVRKGVAGDWHRWFTRRDGELFQSLAGDLLREYGYITDEAWIDALPARLPEIAISGRPAVRE